MGMSRQLRPFLLAIIMWGMPLGLIWGVMSAAHALAERPWLEFWQAVIMCAAIMPAWFAVTGCCQAIVLQLWSVSARTGDCSGQLPPNTRCIVLPERYGYADLRVVLLAPTGLLFVIVSEAHSLAACREVLAERSANVANWRLREICRRLWEQYMLGVIIASVGLSLQWEDEAGLAGAMMLLGAIGWAGIYHLRSASGVGFGKPALVSWPLSFGPRFWAV